MAVLKVSGLKKSFRSGFLMRPTAVLNNINFEVSAGQITGFLGSNGAGKTTTLKSVLRLIRADSGVIEVFGQKDWTPEVRMRIGFLPESPYFYEYLTGQEFLNFHGKLSLRIKGADLTDRISRILKKVDLEGARNRALRTYSKGMLQRIGLAQALIHEPELIILDEPMTGLDPDGRQQISSIIRDVAKSGAAVFFSSHLLHDAEMMCDHLVILKSGEVAYEGATRKLLDSLQAGYQLVHAKEGRTFEEVLGTVQELQVRIDQLRSESHSIVEVRFKRPGLEEAFLKVARKVERD